MSVEEQSSPTKERMAGDLKTAMKAKEKVRVSVLRMLLSELKYAQANENTSKELTEEQVIKITKSYQKRLTKSLSDFPEGEKRDDIRNELAVVEQYLPKAASKEDIEKVVQELIAKSDNPQFGPLMKEALSKLGAGADGKLVSSILKDGLASNS